MSAPEPVVTGEKVPTVIAAAETNAAETPAPAAAPVSGAPEAAAPTQAPATNWLHVAQAGLASLAVHLTILTVLGLVTVGIELEAFDPSVFEVLAAEEPVREVFIAPEAIPDDLLSAEITPEMATQKQDLLSESLPPDAILGEDGSSAAVGPVNPAAAEFMDPALVGTPENTTGPALLASGLDGTGLGEPGQGTGKHGAGTSRFFGVRAAGKSFVFVIDCSGSMGDDDRFQRACDEVFRSISDLRRSQRFFILFYNDTAYPMDADKPLPATPENVEAARVWASRFAPYSDTRPLTALLYALTLEPDAIYFLSDGIFDPETINELARRQGSSSRKVPIHTIAFVSQEGEALMRTIARQSGGKFRFVK